MVMPWRFSSAVQRPTHVPGALAAEAGGEANVEVPRDAAAVQQIAVDWVTGTWRESGDTRWAVAALARLGETHPEFDLGLFIGLDDEWNGGWGAFNRISGPQPGT